MTTNTEVKVFQSTDSGAPVLSGTAGTLIAVLDACLKNGYGDVTLDSVVIAANVATCTKSTGHGFTMIGNVGPVIRISGATPAALNGDWRITVTSTTQFTFATTGISDQTASGTIVAKRAPAGFTKAFSGTNLAAYRSDDVVGTRLYLRIDDTGTTDARIRGYEVMTDVITGTGLFPKDTQVSGGLWHRKYNGGWVLISDGKLIYFFNGSYIFVFGDINSYKSGDAYQCMMFAQTSAGGTSYLYTTNYTTAGCYLARSYTQLGESVTCSRYTHGRSASLGSCNQVYPSPIDNGAHFWPVECWESDTLARGLMPGFWCPIHTSAIPVKTVITDVPLSPGRSFYIMDPGAAAVCRVGIDITGPWR